MYLGLISVALVLLFGQQALAQGSCNKNIDCVNNAFCQMPDFYQYPTMWPPCPHAGTCTCNNGFLQITNGSCVPIINLNLYDRCSSQLWERYNTCQRCNGTHVICNTPSCVDAGGYCNPAPTPSVAPAPAVVVTITCGSVSYLSFCDGKSTCCGAGTGLTCQQRGSNSTYSQCLCSVKTNIFDQSLGYCRPRRYGDYCTANDECASNLISNTGFECRLGRCRCSNGYEPVDNQFWNETSLNTYTLRICVSSGAVTWVPTGGSCTMDPHMFAQFNSTRVCHQRAFCHLCSPARRTYAYASTLTAGVVGVCRERTCSNDGDCGTYSNGRCNNFGMQIDPPCDNGVCDCNWNNGFYKDRFSRCSHYNKLHLGQRCIVADGSSQLHPWYVNYEDWDEDKQCTQADKYGGYGGYNWGVVKCQLPLIEDADGNCVRNDDQQYQQWTWLNYQDYCDDTDTRIPLRRCDTSKGLSCINYKCQCATSAACSAGYGGCTNTASSVSVLWDGGRCRARGLTDTCTSSADCCGGQCVNGQCGCLAGLTLVQYSVGASINNGGNHNSLTVGTQSYCFKNYSIVQKGGECHLDPTTWNCGNLQYGYYRSFLPAQVCAQGLTCMRCPFDYNTDDETHGICRAVNMLPDAAPKQCGYSGQTLVIQGQGGQGQPGQGGQGQPGQPGYGYGYGQGRWGANVGRWGAWNAATSPISQTFLIVMLAVAALFA